MQQYIIPQDLGYELSQMEIGTSLKIKYQGGYLDGETQIWVKTMMGKPEAPQNYDEWVLVGDESHYTNSRGLSQDSYYNFMMEQYLDCGYDEDEAEAKARKCSCQCWLFS